MSEAGQTAGLPDAVARLAQAGPDTFLLDHHLEATRHLSRLFERAQLRQRVTMSYDPARMPGRTSSPQADIADTAAEARQRLGKLAGRLPADCWGVLIDVCVYDKGLQQIEQERGWPRRSAKLVLRIGLEQLAGLWGLTNVALGLQTVRQTGWLAERAHMFPLRPDEVA